MSEECSQRYDQSWYDGVDGEHEQTVLASKLIQEVAEYQWEERLADIELALPVLGECIIGVVSAAEELVDHHVAGGEEAHREVVAEPLGCRC